MTEETTPEESQKPPKPEPPKKVSSSDWSYIDPDSAQVSRIQRALGLDGFYQGPANGTWDIKTKKAVQLSLSASGFSVGDTGGLHNYETVHAVLQFAKQFGSYAGPMNDTLSPVVWSAYELGLRKRIS